ncbi:uncharacterized protein LOC117194946 isoform X2 [Drosophila miranda]|uniref:uncharacterized protein LOC117194946 isoform X2 n=1 Tax=Drosophila miranda TaxID=7229 RepID=UPI00143F3A6D|nr:uncharacterized protein LOC117194946 isoform X2 [Drosophila miranda]
MFLNENLRNRPRIVMPKQEQLEAVPLPNKNADIVWRGVRGRLYDSRAARTVPLAFRPYRASGNYSLDLTSSQKAMSPVNKLTYFTLQLFLSDLPPVFLTFADRYRCRSDWNNL